MAQTDYSKWVGKKVYVSDESIFIAREYKNSIDSNYLYTFVEYDTDSSHSFPFKVMSETGTRFSWKYAVLAEDNLIIGDDVHILDNNDVWLCGYVFIAEIESGYLVCKSEHFDQVNNGEHSYIAFARECRQVPIMTRAEAEIKLGVKIID